MALAANACVVKLEQSQVAYDSVCHQHCALAKVRLLQQHSCCAMATSIELSRHAYAQAVIQAGFASCNVGVACTLCEGASYQY
eukprot:9855-Heterococcus_DN1.PRE.2